MLKYIRRTFQVALAGAVIFGATFGFWIKGPELELMRTLGAILAIVLTVSFAPNILRD